MAKRIKIMAISGSLRSNSSNTMLVKAIEKLIPENIDYSIYEDLKSIPLFDESDNPPAAITKFREAIASADGVLICSPEYAYGISGVLKNAIDWTVSSGEFYDKPVAIITAAINGERAHAALLLIFEALSAQIDEAETLIIPFVRSKLNKDGEITDATTLTAIQAVINSFIHNIQHNNQIGELH
ncbi:MAG TPA: NADPH-dependent FMN reductase [Bacteroidales bacterium]